MKMTRSRKNSGEVVERSLASFAAALEHAFYAEKLAKQNGLLQKIDPRVKIVAILPLIVIAALARSLWVIGALFALAIAIALQSKVPLSTLAKRVWLGVLAITGVISVPALFLTPGRAIYNAPLPGWTVTAQGLRAATYLIMRAETAATFSVLLVLCTPWSNLLKAFRVLRLPIVLVVILGMTYRYIFLLLRNAHEMFKSRKSRGSAGSTDGSSGGRLLPSAGVLMSKTLQLSGDVYLAMRSRGFQGEVYVLERISDRLVRLGHARALHHSSGRGFLVRTMSAFFISAKCANRSRRGEVVTVPIFEARDVTYSYQEVTALDGLNLTIMPGERVALLGANGSGKSTLLSMLDGLCFPKKGSIAFQGEILTESRLGGEVEFEFRRQVALLFQNPDVQLFNPTVFDEIAFGPLQLQWPKEKIKAGHQPDPGADGNRALEGPLASSSFDWRKKASCIGLGADPRSRSFVVG